MSELFLINKSTLTEIADAIRNKEGSTDLIPVNEIATRVSQLSGGTSGLGELIPAIDDIIRMDNGLYCTLCCYDLGECVYYPCTSEDGISWQIHFDTPIITDESFERYKVKKVGNVIYVASCDENGDIYEFYGSTDGINYTRIGFTDNGYPMPESDFDSITIFNDSVYVKLDTINEGALLKSTDGLNWTYFFDMYDWSFKIENGCVLGVDISCSGFYYSFDGITYKHNHISFDYEIGSLFYYNGVFIVKFQYQHSLAVSSDNGNSWTEVNLSSLYFEGDNFDIITASEDRPWMAKTEDGQLKCYSFDGFNWHQFQ